MVIHSHTGERAHRLALTAGGDNNNLFRRIVMSFININQNALGNLQITQLLSDINNIHHAAANNCYPTVILHSSINNLLDTMYVKENIINYSVVFILYELSYLQPLSLGVKPGRSALVLSASRHSTPRSPYSANLLNSITCPSTGVWSIF